MMERLDTQEARTMTLEQQIAELKAQVAAMPEVQEVSNVQMELALLNPQEVN